jgi:hypothetical protein
MRQLNRSSPGKLAAVYPVPIGQGLSVSLGGHAIGSNPPAYAIPRPMLARRVSRLRQSHTEARALALRSICSNEVFAAALGIEAIAFRVDRLGPRTHLVCGQDLSSLTLDAQVLRAAP